MLPFCLSHNVKSSAENLSKLGWSPIGQYAFRIRQMQSSVKSRRLDLSCHWINHVESEACDLGISKPCLHYSMKRCENICRLLLFGNRTYQKSLSKSSSCFQFLNKWMHLFVNFRIKKHDPFGLQRTCNTRACKWNSLLFWSSQQQRQCASCRHVLQLQAFQTSGISIKTTYRESRLGLSE